MGQTEIDQAARRAKRARVLGNGACARCGWTGQDGLTKGGDGAVRCYECRLAADGKPTVEAHHLLGRANDLATAAIPGNLHRGLSEAQRAWPDSVRRNAGRDPLLWLAAACLGLRDHLAAWVGWLDAVAAWLVGLSGALVARSGPAWWQELGVGAPWQGVTS